MVGGSLLPQGEGVQAQLVEPEGKTRSQARLVVCTDPPDPTSVCQGWFPEDSSYPGLNPAVCSAPPSAWTLGGR